VHPHHVLIVDDEDDIREIAQLCMELDGWTVLTARSGGEAASAADGNRVDVILLDVMMPGLDGPQTLHLLREEHHTKDIPVIFLTATVQVAEQRHLRDLGACGLIAKPFDPMTLARQVAELMETTRT
jgi:two-component system, OmpR family, alkaline phosphatase synthesis response regulator PhoP